MRFLSVFISLLLLAQSSFAAYTFDGGDDISAANNAVAGIDVDTFSMSCKVNVTTATLPQQFITHAALLAGGNFRLSMSADAPASSGWRFLFYEGFSGQAFALWRANADLSTGTSYQIGVDYNSNTANDPVLAERD